MKNVKMFAVILGIIYGLMGLLGLLIPGTVQGRGIDLGVNNYYGTYGLLFGVFAVNTFSHIYQIAVGIWGVLASRTLNNAIAYCRIIAVLSIVLALFGLIPGLRTLFGLMPLYGNLVWFHALTAAFASYYGWGKLTVRQAHSPAHSTTRR